MLGRWCGEISQFMASSMRRVAGWVRAFVDDDRGADTISSARPAQAGAGESHDVRRTISGKRPPKTPDVLREEVGAVDQDARGAAKADGFAAVVNLKLV